MKSIFSICLLFFTVSLSAMPETPAEKAAQQLVDYGKAFTLTAEQKNAAIPILKEYYTKRAEIKANKDITKKAEEEKLEILKTKRDKQLKAVFGADNWKKWEDYKTKQKAAEKAAKAQKNEQE